ncbi:cysteine synthase A [Longimicrobium terrae]|uniref:cysteine synthase n=1 Tax=Longimicrobium terrae TaxID=1639882 RepID=A0A841GT70_9BACT|nr:cysteine synthase A [Longimicrobium terrae]MBB4635306.1 cysteine synthase A [Longimicrobium terrae]MBB6069699.1 cysteine synthase A [Longimicrobium terrae]NNC31090.1 cysteine synthase A [Longimicrobium terrae]
MSRGRIYGDITQTMGGTPLIQLNRLGAGLPGRIVVKHEGFNPFNSVKDRIGAAMVDDAIARGDLRPGMVVVDPTSGNTGIGVAYAAVARGYRCIFTMPETMTIERRNLLRALGCKVVLTEGAKGMKGAIARAEAIAAALGDRAWMARQFDNPANPAVHFRTTGPEIWEDTDGHIDVFIAGVGTGGTISGAGRYLKERRADLRIIAVEPAESPVISGGQPGPHKQQGIGPGFVPGNLDRQIYDEVIQVTNDDAIATARRLAREEAIFAGISSGSITWAALQVAARPEMEGKLIVSVICDFGERYLSNPVYADQPEPDFSEYEDALAEPATPSA